MSAKSVFFFNNRLYIYPYAIFLRFLREFRIFIFPGWWPDWKCHTLFSVHVVPYQCNYQWVTMCCYLKINFKQGCEIMLPRGCESCHLLKLYIVCYYSSLSSCVQFVLCHMYSSNMFKLYSNQEHLFSITIVLVTPV